MCTTNKRAPQDKKALKKCPSDPPNPQPHPQWPTLPRLASFNRPKRRNNPNSCNRQQQQQRQKEWQRQRQGQWQEEQQQRNRRSWSWSWHRHSRRYKQRTAPTSRPQTAHCLAVPSHLPHSHSQFQSQCRLLPCSLPPAALPSPFWSVRPLAFWKTKLFSHESNEMSRESLYHLAWCPS